MFLHSKNRVFWNNTTAEAVVFDPDLRPSMRGRAILSQYPVDSEGDIKYRMLVEGGVCYHLDENHNVIKSVATETVLGAHLYSYPDDGVEESIIYLLNVASEGQAAVVSHILDCLYMGKDPMAVKLYELDATTGERFEMDPDCIKRVSIAIKSLALAVHTCNSCSAEQDIDTSTVDKDPVITTVGTTTLLN